MIELPRQHGQSSEVRALRAPSGNERIASAFHRFVAAIGGIILFTAGCGPGLDLESSKTFQDAENVFSHASSRDDYLRAAGLDQEILDRGIVSGAVLYNQGNAFMKAGERGRAIAAFRQAQRYRPRDPYLDANLRYALGGDAALTQQKSLIDYFLFWQTWLSYPEKFWLVTAAATLAFVCGIAGRLAERRRVWNRLAVAALVATLILGLSAGYDWYRFEHIRHGVVTKNDTTARKGNSENYEPAYSAPLKEGTEFRLIESRGDWLLIQIPHAGDAWIEAKSAVTY